jgi:hypothetical protein
MRGGRSSSQRRELHDQTGFQAHGSGTGFCHAHYQRQRPRGPAECRAERDGRSRSQPALMTKARGKPRRPSSGVCGSRLRGLSCRHGVQTLPFQRACGFSFEFGFLHSPATARDRRPERDSRSPPYPDAQCSRASPPAQVRARFVAPLSRKSTLRRHSRARGNPFVGLTWTPACAGATTTLSFPRSLSSAKAEERESICQAYMDPRLRGGDETADFRPNGWAQAHVHWE